MSDALNASVGWSASPDAAQAGREAGERALQRLVPRRPKVAIVFGSSWFDQSALLQGLRSALGPVPVAGLSTAGEITPEGPVSHHCVVLLLAADRLACTVGASDGVERDARDAGQHAAYAAMQEWPAGAARVGMLFFGDGLLTSYADVIRGMQEVLGTSSLIVGALAGDDLRFSRTYQYDHHQVISRGVVGVLLGGAVKIGVGIEHGFAPISKPHRITKAHGTTLYEIDGRKAAAVYEEYFGPEVIGRMRREGLSRQKIAYPLGIQRHQEAPWLLRNVVSFGTDGSLGCTGEVFEDSALHVMIGSRELALEAAREAARQAVRGLNHVAAVLVFDSAVRRTLLGPQQAAEELRQVQHIIGNTTALAGCYTYGEQAPVESASAYERTMVQTGSVLVVALGT